MAKPATIGEYIGALPEPLADVAGLTRHVIGAELAVGESAIEWAQPVWSIGKEAGRLSEGGVRPRDVRLPARRVDGRSLRPARELRQGDGHVELRRPEDVDRTLFVSWPRRALAIELAGA
jgi:hypothetical protein